ncbi:GNAT family N-acetyltransferase [Kribbella sp. NPDC056861]|uniref:GNAT family N-acetyltransferase n=1 Tax=Kribbella sp. NPDC056861 TaxID=3154857 RepID=UPI00343D40C5
MIPTAQELAAYTLERQHPLTRQWVDDETRLALLTNQHAELDVLLAEDKSIAEARIARLAPGTPVDAMLNHWVAIGDDLHAMLSMRFEGMDVTKPFVDASPLSRPLESRDLPGLAGAAREVYQVHSPRHVRLWSSEPVDAFPGAQRDRRFLGAPLTDLRPHDVPAGLALVPATGVDHYDEAVAAYAAVDEDHPEHPGQASLASQEDLQDSADAGLLFDITMNGTWAGYSAAYTDSEDTLGVPSYVVRDVLLAKPFRGQGLGRHLAPLLAQSLPEQSHILLGAIHANNTGARTAALTAGRQDVGGWLLQPL